MEQVVNNLSEGSEKQRGLTVLKRPSINSLLIMDSFGGADAHCLPVIFLCSPPVSRRKYMILPGWVVAFPHCHVRRCCFERQKKKLLYATYRERKKEEKND